MIRLLYNHPGHGENRNRTLYLEEKKQAGFFLWLILTLNKSPQSEEVEQIQPFKYLSTILGAEGTKASNSQRAHSLEKGHLYNWWGYDIVNATINVPAKIPTTVVIPSSSSYL